MRSIIAIAILAVVAFAPVVAAGGSTFTVSGRVVDIEKEEGIRKAKIRIPGIGTFRTDIEGDFTLAFSTEDPDPKPIRALIKNAGYVPHWTYIVPGQDNEEGVHSLDLSRGLMPRPKRGEVVRVKHFDHVFRDLGHRGTIRWQEDRMFVEISPFVYERVSPDGEPYLYRVTGSAPSAFVSNARRAAREANRRLTDRKVKTRVRVVRPHGVGDLVSHDALFSPGAVRWAVVLDHGHPQSSQAFLPTCAKDVGGDVACMSRVDINPLHAGRYATFLHEAAHILGGLHPDLSGTGGYYDMPFPSIFGADHDDLTEEDELYWRILYSRPSGSMSPDVDPNPLAEENPAQKALRRVTPILDTFPVLVSATRAGE